MKFILSMIVLCFLSTINLHSESHKGKIYLYGNEVIKSKAIIIGDSVVKYRLTTEPNTLVVNKSEIRKIVIVDGNYGLYGLGAGLVLSLPFANYAGSHNDAYITLAAGGCIGLLIGTLINDYRTINFNQSEKISFLEGVKLLPEINQPNITLINYSVSF